MEGVKQYFSATYIETRKAHLGPSSQLDIHCTLTNLLPLFSVRHHVTRDLLRSPAVCLQVWWDAKLPVHASAAKTCSMCLTIKYLCVLCWGKDRERWRSLLYAIYMHLLRCEKHWCFMHYCLLSQRAIWIHFKMLRNGLFGCQIIKTFTRLQQYHT